MPLEGNKHTMKPWILMPLVASFLCSGCSTLFSVEQDGTNKEKTTQGAESNTLNNIGAFFGGTPQNTNIPSSEGHSLRGTRLPNSFQQQAWPQRPNHRMALTPLRLTHVDGNTWRTAANPLIVYGIISRLLSQNYIISSSDRKSMNIHTDWDKFFIDGRLFRNRMSVSVFPVGNRQTEVVIKNSVEYYSGSVGKQEENTAWLPSPDLTDEVSKLVESTDKQTAFAYGQNVR
jgi:hypothetical protein